MADPHAPMPKDEAGSSSPQSVLIVEDDTPAEFLLRHALAKIGLSDTGIRSAPTLALAVAALQAETPDVIILDLGLPDSEGPDTVRRIRGAALQVPIVVVSADDDVGAAVTSLHQGADDYLVKGAYDSVQLARALRYARERRQLWIQAHRRRAEAARAERRLRTVVEANIDGMLIVDPRGTIRFVNERGRAMLDLGDAAPEGRQLGIPLGSADAVEVEAVGRTQGALRIDMRTVEVDWEGTAAHLVILRDVTESRKLEDRLRQAQKMEALGQLTGGIAHDFNNVLSVILNGAEALTEMLPTDLTEAHAELSDISTSARRAAGMIRRLLGFSRSGYLRFETLDLREFTRDTLDLVRRIFPDEVEVRATVEQGEGPIRADPGSLQQIFLNIVANARDAMPEGGAFTVEVRTVDLDLSHRVDHPWVRPGRFECVSFTDTGQGMSEETRIRIFEPFFTTKGPDEGTGLGMAMVYGLMKQHRGMVHVYSEVREGTRVELLFPTAEVVDHPKSEFQAVEPAAGDDQKTLLVIEDEPALRRGMERILTSAGYHVLLARDGAQGLAVFESEGERVDLVLSDLVMPNLGGREVLDELRNRGARCGFVLVTGNGLDSVTEFRARGVVTLSKPWTRRDLLHAIRQALQEGTSAPEPES